MATVLVVEDNADLREMYEEILTSGGHVVCTAENAEQALATAESARPEVGVLDLSIIGDVDRFVEALGPKVKVILASGARNLPECAAALGVPYLVKPFDMEQLLDVVAAAVSPNEDARDGR